MALCHDLPRAADLDAAMRIVESVRLHLLGDGLLTVNRIAGAAAQNEVGGADLEDVVELQRIWTSNPLAYPLAGRKRKSMTPWTRQLLHRAEVFVGEGDVALAQAFNDHALISSLGLRAVVNVPLLDDRGQCFATFNALGIRARWQPEEIWLIRLLAALATPAVAKGAADAMT
jgi:GAF domain-containing protein